MSESKTARASAVRTVKEVHVETTEEAIKAIRDNRAAGLHIGDMSRVDKLLAEYDNILMQYNEAVNTLARVADERNALKATTVVMAEVDNSEIGGEA